jgi:hypothetical protein
MQLRTYEAVCRASAVLQIPDILVRIRIRGSGSADPYLRLTDPDPSIFDSDIQGGN